MSGRRELWPTNGGYPVVDDDLQATADAGAGADDLVYESLLLPGRYAENPAIGAFRKRVAPLMPEGAAQVGGLATSGAENAANLVCQSSAGTLTIRPALYAAFGPASGSGEIAQLAGLVAKVRASQTIALTSGAGTNPRYDLLYATVARTTSVTGNRLIKSTVDGTTSTQSVPLATDAAVTFTLLPGTPAGSPSAPSAPADTGTAWNIPLALVLVPAAYTAGGDVLTAGGSITPIWRRAGVAAEAVGAITELGVTDSGVATHAATYWNGDLTPGTGTFASIPGGGGALYRAMAQVEHLTSGTVLLDSGRDWSLRLARIAIVLPVPHGGSPVYDKLNATQGSGPASGVGVAGGAGGATWDSGWVLTGPKGGGGLFVTTAPAAGLFNAATTGSVSISVDSSGRLAMTFSAAPAGGLGSAPRYVVLVEYTDRFLAQ